MTIIRSFDGSDLTHDSRPLTLRCDTCGGLDTLVEYTVVPRHMGATLYTTRGGSLIADLRTGDDETFWDAEHAHTWACRSCTTEHEDPLQIFSIEDE